MGLGRNISVVDLQIELCGITALFGIFLETNIKISWDLGHLLWGTDCVPIFPCDLLIDERWDATPRLTPLGIVIWFSSTKELSYDVAWRGVFHPVCFPHPPSHSRRCSRSPRLPQQPLAHHSHLARVHLTVTCHPVSQLLVNAVPNSLEIVEISCLCIIACT